jgi:predicted nucleic acid-binding protein
MAVIDASVAVRWFVHGPGNDRAAPWLERTDLIAPDFIIVEVGNAFWRYIQRKHLEIEEAVEILRQLPGSFARLIPIGDVVIDALRIAKEHDHPIYDCCYLALAQREGRSLVTLDRDMATIATQIGISAELLL